MNDGGESLEEEKSTKKKETCFSTFASVSTGFIVDMGNERWLMASLCFSILFA